jgi:sorting nexin-9/18/33
MPVSIIFFVPLFQVHALYDFEAQPDTGELNLVAGEVLTLTRTDVGEGWWEGKNARGEVGLFPEAYVEVGSTRRLFLLRY